MKFLEEENWNKFPEIIQHFYRTDENTASIIYGLQYIPFILIVVQKGVLRHGGKILVLNIELINEILEGKEFVGEES